MAEKAKAAQSDGASGSGGGGDRSALEANLENKFEGPKLHGEEEEELDLSGEVEELLAETRWLGFF